MTEDKSSKIGLPETKLGILPGFGGTQRLPKLIGLPQALGIILEGKVISYSQAKKINLIDETIKLPENKSDIEKYLRQELLKAADILTKKGKAKAKELPLKDKLLTFNPVGRLLTRKKAEAESYKKTKGHYPAITKSIEIATKGLSMPLKKGLELEAQALGDLIVTKESKSLVHLFFLTEASQKIVKKYPNEAISKLGIVGGGIMGRGMASLSVKSGIETTVVDLSKDQREATSEHVKSFIDKTRSIKEGDKAKIFSLLKVSDSVTSLKDAELVVEAIVEDLGIKQKLLNDLEAQVSSSAILASNTSSLKLSDVFANLEIGKRGIGIHFFNPVEKMPLVEIIRTNDTDDRTLIRASALAAKLGKFPVIVEDVPGFLVNRILTPFLLEAGVLLKEGVPLTSIEKVVTDFGFPMGPFRLIDEVGLDIALKVESVLSSAYGERMKGSDIASQLVTKGFLGRKNKKGFYTHEGKDSSPNLTELQSLGVKVSGQSPISSEEILDRLLLSMIAEAIRCYDEEVAGAKSPDALGQIDLASVMGFGFPAFRGGIMHFTKTVGFKNVLNKIDSLKSKGPRFNLEINRKDFNL
jgi:3-hydroxyacyl-CoA dehydrogenase/enoyl-CoA hydratase/3-hydroxybutyryl-CoA epimerase